MMCKVMRSYITLLSNERPFTIGAKAPALQTARHIRNVAEASRGIDGKRNAISFPNHTCHSWAEFR